MTSEQLAEFKQFGDRVSRDQSYVSMVASDSREAKDLSARLASTTARSERADASLNERSTFAERVSTAYERGESISIDIAQDPHNLAMFTRYAEQYGGSSASARVLMEAELARQSIHPNRVFSDGTAVPTSFSDLSAQHLRNTGSPTLAPDLGSQHRANQGNVRGSGGGPRPAPPVDSPSAVRNEVQTEGIRIRMTSSADQATFERKAQISKTSDGTLASERSLMKQSVNQVKEDAAPIVDDAKQAIKDALRR